MTDQEVNYRAIARQAMQKRGDYRTLWKPAALRTTARKLVGQLRMACAPMSRRMDSPGEEEFTALAAE